MAENQTVDMGTYLASEYTLATKEPAHVKLGKTYDAIYFNAKGDLREVRIKVLAEIGNLYVFVAWQEANKKTELRSLRTTRFGAAKPTNKPVDESGLLPALIPATEDRLESVWKSRGNTVIPAKGMPEAFVSRLESQGWQLLKA